jgi:hypothetical protein
METCIYFMNVLCKWHVLYRKPFWKKMDWNWNQREIWNDIYLGMLSHSLKFEYLFQNNGFIITLKGYAFKILIITTQ